MDVLELWTAFQDEHDDDKILDVDLDGRGRCSPAIDALDRDRQEVYDECQNDAESDDVDIKQVAERIV